MRGTVIHDALEDVVRDHPGPVGEDYEAIVFWLSSTMVFAPAVCRKHKWRSGSHGWRKMAEWFAKPKQETLRAGGRHSPALEQDVEANYVFEVEGTLRDPLPGGPHRPRCAGQPA